MFLRKKSQEPGHCGVQTVTFASNSRKAVKKKIKKKRGEQKHSLSFENEHRLFILQLSCLKINQKTSILEKSIEYEARTNYLEVGSSLPLP